MKKNTQNQKKCSVSTVNTDKINMKLSYVFFAVIIFALAAGKAVAQAPATGTDSSAGSTMQPVSENGSFCMYPNPAATMLTIVMDKYADGAFSADLLMLN